MQDDATAGTSFEDQVQETLVGKWTRWSERCFRSEAGEGWIGAMITSLKKVVVEEDAVWEWHHTFNFGMVELLRTETHKYRDKYPQTQAHAEWCSQLRAVDLLDQYATAYNFSRPHRGHGGWPRLLEYDISNVVHASFLCYHAFHGLSLTDASKDFRLQLSENLVRPYREEDRWGPPRVPRAPAGAADEKVRMTRDHISKAATREIRMWFSNRCCFKVESKKGKKVVCRANNGLRFCPACNAMYCEKCYYVRHSA